MVCICMYVFACTRAYVWVCIRLLSKNCWKNNAKITQNLRPKTAIICYNLTAYKRYLNVKNIKQNCSIYCERAASICKNWVKVMCWKWVINKQLHIVVVRFTKKCIMLELRHLWLRQSNYNNKNLQILLQNNDMCWNYLPLDTHNIIILIKTAKIATK